MSAVELTPGTRLQSTTCATQVIVVRAPNEAVDVRCGGAAMTTELGAAPVAEPDPELAGGSLLGKRYTDGAGLELLVTKAGTGALSVGAVPLEVKAAARLPSSD